MLASPLAEHGAAVALGMAIVSEANPASASMAVSLIPLILLETRRSRAHCGEFGPACWDLTQRSATVGPFTSSGAQLSLPTVVEHFAAGMTGRYAGGVPPSRVICV